MCVFHEKSTIRTLFSVFENVVTFLSQKIMITYETRQFTKPASIVPTHTLSFANTITCI